jgi:hypothetical protein
MTTCMSYKSFTFILQCLHFDGKEAKKSRLRTDKLTVIEVHTLKILP